MSEQKVKGLREVLGPVVSLSAFEHGATAMARKVATRPGGQSPLSAEEEAAAALLAGMFESVFLVAVADGELVDAEADELASVLSQLTEGRVTDDDVQTLFDACVTALEREGFDERALSVAKRLPGGDERRAAFVLAAGMSWADGTLHPHEREMLVRLGRAFDLSDDERASLEARVASELR